MRSWLSLPGVIGTFLRVCERVSVRKSECAKKWAWERVSMRKSECAKEWVWERVSVRKSECEKEWVCERASVRKSECASITLNRAAYRLRGISVVVGLTCSTPSCLRTGNSLDRIPRRCVCVCVCVWVWPSCGVCVCVVCVYVCVCVCV